MNVFLCECFCVSVCMCEWVCEWVRVRVRVGMNSVPEPALNFPYWLFEDFFSFFHCAGKKRILPSVLVSRRKKEILVQQYMQFCLCLKCFLFECWRFYFM